MKRPVEGVDPAMGMFTSLAERRHEAVLHGYDEPTGLRTIIALHSTALGPAIGGTRFFPYSSDDEALHDVLRLSEAMSLKAAAVGLAAGGGKAVILGDPRSEKTPQLLAAYASCVDSLGGRYITAEDVGTTQEDMAIIRRTTRWVTGVPHSLGGLGDPSRPTAQGLFAAMGAVGRFLWGTEGLHGRRVAIQGVGKVGRHFAELLVEAGCEVVVADLHEGAVRSAVEELGVKSVGAEDILAVDCDVLAPCALGGVLDTATIPELACSAIVGSANNQLAKAEDALRIAERGILYVPDFVVNAGGLITVYAEAHGEDTRVVDRRIAGLDAATTAILEAAREEGTTPQHAATRIAEKRIAEAERRRRAGREARR